MHRLVLEFNGHTYEGWQKQTRTNNTIQGQLEAALAKVFKKEVLTKGSGRTDSGVHAKSFIVIFQKPFEILDTSLVRALNSNLPLTIRVKNCEPTNIKIPTSEAKSRTYKYFFSNKADASPFTLDLITNVSFKLDINAMKKACEVFVGEHDFNSFHTKGSDPNTTVRKIISCDIKYIEESMEGLLPDCYCITVRGTGFLKQMVRLMVGSIWKVGQGKLTVDELSEALDTASGEHIAPVAPPQGLIKFHVEY